MEILAPNQNSTSAPRPVAATIDERRNWPAICREVWEDSRDA
jgi:hypothetical protein